jgi:transposase
MLYDHLNQIHSSRRLEREVKRNVELMWLTGRLAPDFKTIAEVDASIERYLDQCIDHRLGVFALHPSEHHIASLSLD